jgi:hypothetical protein
MLGGLVRGVLPVELLQNTAATCGRQVDVHGDVQGVVPLSRMRAQLRLLPSDLAKMVLAALSFGNYSLHVPV